MLTYNESNPPIQNWVRASKRLLEKNEKAKEMGDTIQICTRQPKNLQTLMGGCKSEPRGSTDVPPDAGCFKCGKCRVVCPVLNEGDTLTSTATQKIYKMKQKTTCDSDWVVYLLTFKKCKGHMWAKVRKPSKKDSLTTREISRRK